jgi:hypothetical protein
MRIVPRALGELGVEHFQAQHAGNLEQERLRGFAKESRLVVL